jgi:sporulation protein YlmC with PRC-barrel domain
MRFTAWAVSTFVLSAFVAAAPSSAQDRVDANGMPTTHSTPQEQAQTANLNSQVADANNATDQQTNTADGQYQAQQQQYQQQLEQNRQAQQDYQQKSADYASQAARYESLRARYAAERAAYHRGVWPDRYARWTIDQYTADLLGQRVEILNGDRVGTVKDVARNPDGRVEALLVQLDSDKIVWIDRSDIRYDRADGIVMTNLARTDLRQMADERL